MAGDAFKHIVVTPAEEDDEVVHAGLGALVSDAGRESPESPAGADAPAGSPTGSEASRAPAQGKPEKDEQSLDELRVEPMSATQKAVIIAAVICIIGALAYYFVALR